MFKKNLSKIIDDPGRFSSAYMSFLAEEGTIRDLNAGYTSVRKVLRKQVKDLSAFFSYLNRAMLEYYNLGLHNCRNR